MKWLRHQFQPCKGLGEDGRRISGSQEHIALSRRAAGEGIVLLKNENAILPIPKGKNVVLLGKAGEEYIKGGGGSGEVSVAYIRTLFESLKLKEAEGKLRVYDGLHPFYAADLKAQLSSGAEPGMTREPALSQAQLDAAAAFSDTAIVAICRFSGEGWDRSCHIKGSENANVKSFWAEEDSRREAGSQIFQRGDFYLSDEEQALVEQAKARFAHVIVTLNVGGVVDTCWFCDDSAIEAAVMIGQCGMEGALAAADILVGDVNPSGKLVDTYAKDLTDYPSTDSFHESADYVKYYEDIYVGYRYFETMPGAAEKVNYPFGFGLSYTTFSWKAVNCAMADGTFFCNVTVKNTGSVPGKEVLQLYYRAPQGKLGKPAIELGTYAKTPLLAPGEETLLTLTLPVGAMASYDDLGKVCKSAWVLEAGDYHFCLGTSVRDVQEVFSYGLEEDFVVEQLSEHLKPRKLEKRLLADGSYEALEQGEYEQILRPFTEAQYEDLEGVKPEVRFEGRSKLWGGEVRTQLEDVLDGKLTLDAFLDSLTLEEQVWLLGGQPNTGVANTFGIGNNQTHGIPNIMTADGPAGVRIMPQLELYTTAWPCATMLASTWNRELVQEIGAAGGMELKENNLGSWLTPALNIHRSPLCGRNFEYYSEDPLIAGTMAASMILGIQSQHVAATPKHFAFNNKETNRKSSDSRLSERAAREIYLKGFEIAVKEADPWMIMSSYNLVNGRQTSECRELLTDILRGEWGFRGIVTTDWWTRGEHWREVNAGNDLKMANGYPETVLEAIADGRVSKEQVRTCAKRILEFILKVE